MNKIIVIDTETASINGGVCDLAVIEINENLDIVRSTEALLDPKRRIVPAAQAVHGITNAQIADEPTAEEYRELYGNPFDHDGDLYVVGHNVQFDCRHLAAEGWLPQSYRKVCTLRMARNLWPDLKEDEENHKLGTLAIMFGLEAGTAHRAMGDAVTCLNLLRHIAATGHVSSFDELLALGQRPLSLETKITFGKHRGTKLKDLPSDYVGWLRRQSDMDPDLLEALKAR